MIKEGTCTYLQTEVHINDQSSLVSKIKRGDTVILSIEAWQLNKD